MTSTTKQETSTDQIRELIDTEAERLMIVKHVRSAAPLSFSGDVPLFRTDLYEVATADQKDPAGEPLLLAKLEKMQLRLSKRVAPMPFTRRHIDADEVWFIHTGNARIFTELGSFEASPGWVIFIARGVGYRICPDGDFMAYILESEVMIRRTESWQMAELAPRYPEFPPRLPESGTTEWEERLVTRSWSAKAMRGYDPLSTREIKSANDLVYAVDIKDVPEVSPKRTWGAPFELFSSPVLQWDVSKRTEPLTFYHRNTRLNELYFVHAGGGGHDTDLGYVDGQVGWFYNLPKGVGHTVVDRKAPSTVMVMETAGEVIVNPEILKGT